MFACDCVISRVDGTVTLERGSFFNLPPELGGSNKIAKYASFVRAGWHTIDFGYQALVRFGPDGTRYCFPGVIPDSSSFKNKLRITNLFTVTKVDEYATSIDAQEKSLNASLREDFNLLVHDLRRLSTVIYNAAEEAKNTSGYGYDVQLQRLIENIIGAQSMLRIRIDMVDFSGNPLSQRSEMNVQVFRKVDKVVRSFRPLADRANVRLDLSGSSFSTSYGPDSLEILIYILVDNAVKYSPHNGEVNVFVADDVDHISFSVSSIGPEVKPHELTKIFERGYRGEMTRERSDAGSGLGLYLCSRIISDFGGKIDVEVGKREIATGKGVSRDIKFTVQLPKS